MEVTVKPDVILLINSITLILGKIGTIEKMDPEEALSLLTKPIIRKRRIPPQPVK